MAKDSIMDIISVSEPIYSAPDNSQIDCTIVCELGELRFTAHSKDVEPHGIQLFNDLVAGKYGAIEPYPSSA